MPTGGSPCTRRRGDNAPMPEGGNAHKVKRARKRGSGGDAEGGGALVRRIAWIVLAVAWVFIATALVSFDPADPPSHVVYPHHESAHNWMGTAGAHVSYWLLSTLGWGAAVLMMGTGLALVLSAMGRSVKQPLVRAAGIAVLAAATAGLAGAIAPHAGLPMPQLPGGTLGVVLGGVLVDRFNTGGAALWMLAAGAIGLVVAFDELALHGTVWLGRTIRRGMVASWRGARAAAVWLGGFVSSRVRRPALTRAHDLDEEEEVIEQPRPRRRREPAPIQEQAGGPGGVAPFDPSKAEEVERDEFGDEEEEAAGAPQVFDRDKLRQKISALPVRFAQSNRASASDEDLSSFHADAELEGYRFPPIDLLEEPEEGFDELLEEHVREQAESLESALREYRIDGEVVGIDSGPVITLYHVRLAPGTKVAALNAVSSDLARALKSTNIRVVANMAGRDTVGIEVPNAKKEKVRLRELMADPTRSEKMQLPMYLGKDASGDPLIADLTRMPHVLIAGTTGSGKSVCMNTIVMSFLYTRKPNELKLVLVDPKMVEMSQFKDVPHLMCPVVTEMGKAAAILEWAVGKMDERYELLAEAGVRDIAAYNSLEEDELLERFAPPGQTLSEQEAARIPRRLPYMVFIIDELADLMMTNKEVEGSIVRIAQKARAVGIHLILATQRPQANVVTGLIKGNMPCRITFKVASGLDSRIVLDQKGGELLLGQGDMLLLNPSSDKLMRCQGTLVDDGEIRRVTRFLRDVAAPSFERSLVQIKHGAKAEDAERLAATENNSSASLAAAQEDPLFDRAVEIVLETQRGSVSLLQRRLAIGYTRASRLIDLMGIAGIIGEHKGSVAREVLITPDEWEAIKAMADEMAAAQGITRPTSGGGEEPEPMLFEGVEEEEAESEEEAYEDEGWEEAGDEEDDGWETEDEEESPPFEPTDEAAERG